MYLWASDDYLHFVHANTCSLRLNNREPYCALLMRTERLYENFRKFYWIQCNKVFIVNCSSGFLGCKGLRFFLEQPSFYIRNRPRLSKRLCWMKSFELTCKRLRRYHGEICKLHHLRGIHSLFYIPTQRWKIMLGSSPPIQLIISEL